MLKCCKGEGKEEEETDREEETEETLMCCGGEEEEEEEEEETEETLICCGSWSFMTAGTPPASADDSFNCFQSFRRVLPTGTE